MVAAEGAGGAERSGGSVSRASLSEPDVRAVPVYIYALCEPTTGAVRYIGKSASPEKRLGNHLHAGRYKIAAWVSELAASGLRPVLNIIETVAPGNDASARERLAIAMHLSRGCKLLNSEGTHFGRGPQPRPGDFTNQGAAALAALNLTQMRIAEVISCAQSNVSSWMKCKTLPEPVLRARLEDAFGIYWRLWDAPVVLGEKGQAA